jgi:hypothetical protein
MKRGRIKIFSDIGENMKIRVLLVSLILQIIIQNASQAGEASADTLVFLEKTLQENTMIHDDIRKLNVDYMQTKFKNGDKCAAITGYNLVLFMAITEHFNTILFESYNILDTQLQMLNKKIDKGENIPDIFYRLPLVFFREIAYNRLAGFRSSLEFLKLHLVNDFLQCDNKFPETRFSPSDKEKIIKYIIRFETMLNEYAKRFKPKE